MFIAASNTPWEIDNAILSRFEKRILIPLPDKEAKEGIFRIEIEKKGYESEVSFVELAERTEGYSGRDIKNLCKEVINSMIRNENKEIYEIAGGSLEMIKRYELRTRALTKFQGKFFKV